MIYMAKPQIGDEEKKAVMEVLDSGILAQGPRVKAFEEGFAKMCGVKHAVATSSGTTALHVAMLAHGVGANTFIIIRIMEPFWLCAGLVMILPRLSNAEEPASGEPRLA